MHWLGGLASASFYVPFRRVRGWSWETYWLTGGVISWVVAPWLLAECLTHNLLHVLRVAPLSAVIWTYFFGVLWGLGGLTFGLTMRYLGLSLGMSVALGYTAVFGTLVPPIFHGQFMQLLAQRSGVIILIGVGICIAGIVLAGAAGISKETELSQEEKLASIQEFSLKRGLGVATFCGVMSSCFAFGLDAGNPIKAITVEQGTTGMWQGLPVLVVLLAGGFTTNFIWCFVLGLQNGSFREFLRIPDRSGSPAVSLHPPIENITDAASTEMALDSDFRPREPASLAANYGFSALAGATWYMQFFFYTMGET